MQTKQLPGAAVVILILLTAVAAAAQAPKYVFLFIGDGMGKVQIQAAESLLRAENNGTARLTEGISESRHRLRLSKLPVHGSQTTHNADGLITDSAAAGTALACGIKTANGVIGRDAAQTVDYQSIARLAAAKGKQVGLISSAPLNHATPAAFYANISDRGLSNNIATQLTEANYTFYGGGSLESPTRPAKDGDTGNNTWQLLTAKGYTVLNSRAAILALKNKPKRKTFCINPLLQADGSMPFAIDRPNDNLSLAEMTGVATSVLGAVSRKNRPDHGFFLMVEGGKIDWACHAGDARTAIGELLDFDEAIGVALDFYRKHPRQTLIVVTGDHETGGMTLRQGTNDGDAHPERLLGQPRSFQYFREYRWQPHKVVFSQGYDFTSPTNLEGNTAMIALLESELGLKWAQLSDSDKIQLEDGYDQSMCGRNHNSKEENQRPYGNREPIIAAGLRILNQQAGISWGSSDHTGVDVPVFAMGRESLRFSGAYDNTDIAKQMALAMGIRRALPRALPNVGQ